jgi:SAM-dependent methyltransferase
MPDSVETWLERMRLDWDRRAAEDAERHIYTRDDHRDEPDFDRSGLANYNQLVRPFLPVFLGGAPADSATVVEIGCGVGRMTAAFASAFRRVHALDVSPKMLAEAGRRLAAFPNVSLHLSSGRDLAAIPSASADLVFSYIVFQHIPSKDLVESYFSEAARVLNPGGIFKFQVNGDQSPAYRAHRPDTWLGVAYSAGEIAPKLAAAGFSLLAAEGSGTQYFTLTARKGPPPPLPGLPAYVLPGEPWSQAHLIEGWGPAVDASWRPVQPQSRARLGAPAGEGPVRFFAGIYFWPERTPRVRTLRISLDAALIGEVTIGAAGDHYIEVPCPACSGAQHVLEWRIDPAPGRPPAVRCFGLYRPR